MTLDAIPIMKHSQTTNDDPPVGRGKRAYALVVVFISLALLGGVACIIAYVLTSSKAKTRLIDVPGDGDCLYHAVATAMSSSTSEHTDGRFLRKRLAEYIGDNKQKYISKYGHIGLSEVTHRINTLGTWGESEEIELLADMLKSCIQVQTLYGVQTFQPEVGQVNGAGAISDCADCRSALQLVNMDNTHFAAYARVG